MSIQQPQEWQISPFKHKRGRARIPNMYRLCDGHAEIKIADRYISLIDTEDVGFAQQFHWGIVGGRTGLYVCSFLWNGQNRTKTIAHLHRLLINADKEFLVDHANGNTLDNRKGNLRPCTIAQNHYNSAKRKGSSSFKGVTAFRNKWLAKIGHQRKTVHIGLFFAQEDAARAYDRKAIELFGEFARTNFPREQYA